MSPRLRRGRGYPNWPRGTEDRCPLLMWDYEDLSSSPNLELHREKIRNSQAYPKTPSQVLKIRKGRNCFSDHTYTIQQIRLSINPEKWTVSDTMRFLAQTSDCAHLAHFIANDQVSSIIGIHNRLYHNQLRF